MSDQGLGGIVGTIFVVMIVLFVGTVVVGVISWVFNLIAALYNWLPEWGQLAMVLGGFFGVLILIAGFFDKEDVDKGVDN